MGDIASQSQHYILLAQDTTLETFPTHFCRQSLLTGLVHEVARGNRGSRGPCMVEFSIKLPRHTSPAIMISTTAPLLPPNSSA